MKIRDLKEAILEFELSNIPKILLLWVIVILCFIHDLLWTAIKVYKSLWGIILLGCIILFFVGIETGCYGNCNGLIHLKFKGYALTEKYFYIIIALLVSIVVSFKLDKFINKNSKKSN